MKVVILAGGYGTRISEESATRPKPMVEIGGMPILWHIMKGYLAYGLSEFVICCGYKGHVIKEWFSTYSLRASDVTFDMAAQTVEYHSCNAERWRVTLIDTGDGTMTGGRIKRIAPYVGKEPFCLTYGDGVSDVDIGRLVEFHRTGDALVTMTAVQPEGRFGAFVLKDEASRIEHFREKPKGDGAWINGGFFVLDPAIFDYIEGDATVWEQEPLTRLAAEGQVAAFRHSGFWLAMDTLRDRNVLEELWSSGAAPWKRW